RLEVQGLAWSHVERVIPGVEVANGRNSKVFRSVTVGGDLGAQRFLPRLAAPRAREADEELAVQLFHVLRVAGLAAERMPIGVERSGEAAEIGYILDQRLLAVDRCVGKRAVVGELLHERSGCRFVAGHVFRCPPMSLAPR